MVDCCTYSFGCDGGNENSGLEYVAKYGITTEDVYPYVFIYFYIYFIIIRLVKMDNAKFKLVHIKSMV